MMNSSTPSCVTFTLFSQTALSGCNSYTVQERYARWLLMMHGRTNIDIFAFTQEFLSRILGVSRARVNIVTGVLEKAGLIKHSRNQIAVLDWKDLKRLLRLLSDHRKNLREYWYSCTFGTRIVFEWIALTRGSPCHANEPRRLIPRRFSPKSEEMERISPPRSRFFQGDAAEAVFYIQGGKIKMTVVSQRGKKPSSRFWNRVAWRILSRRTDCSNVDGDLKTPVSCASTRTP